MSLGAFTIIKNEKEWIAAHILRVLPYVDEMVFMDGNSGDGTVEIIEAIRDNDKNGHKIRLFKNKDPKDLRQDYVNIFNEAIGHLTTDLAWFAHPDFWVVNPEQISIVKDSPAIALSTNIRSFGGEPGGQLYEMMGRATEWKNIYRLRNPDLGTHYHGFYGAWNEDCYFTQITGDEHILYEDFSKYPYEVVKSGIDVLHFSDVRPLSRRISRMKSCLANNDWLQDRLEKRAVEHPRVTFKNVEGYRFIPSEYPKEMIETREKYKHLERSKELVRA